MSIYMQFTRSNGRVIKGDVTEADHQGWIELRSAQVGVPRNVTSPTGRGTNGDANGRPQEIVITKSQDSASTDLFKECTWGEAATVQMDFVKRDDGATPGNYMSLTLEGTLITSFFVPGNGGDANAKPTETLSLNSKKMGYAVATAGRLIPGAKAKP